MNQKKCPKCGENNPAEAVMCWACYTPLTGGSALASGGAIASGSVVGGAEAVGGMATDAPASSKKIEPWQLGVIGGGLLLASLVAFSSLRPSSSPPGEGLLPLEPPTWQEEGGGGVGPGAPPSPPRPIEPPPPPPPPDPENGPEFTIVSPPNPRQRWATMGILLSQGTDIRRAAVTAAAAGQQAMRGGRWGGIHVFVFTDRTAASAFRGYQKERGGAPVNLSAIPSRYAIGPNVILRYEMTKDGKQKFNLSSPNPS